MERTISNEGIASLTLELSLLLHAGINMADGLAMLAEEEDYKELLAGMPEKADEGEPLSACLRESGRFPAYVCGLIEMGEHSGRLKEALRALSRYYERRVRLDRRIRSALLYPAVMLILMLLVIGVLLVKVLPIFDEVYASLGGRLTGVAGGLLVLGRWMDKAMPVLWVLLALVVAFCAAFALLPGFREKLLGSWRRSHGDKGVSRSMNTARVVQAMAMGMSSGLMIEDALELSAALLEDIPPAQARCRDCLERLDHEESLSAAMRESGMLSVSSSRLLELGQRSGTADEAMEKIAKDMTEESENAVEELVGRVEPALVLVCSLLVGLILLSVMLPLMHIMTAIG